MVPGPAVFCGRVCQFNRRWAFLKPASRAKVPNPAPQPATRIPTMSTEKLDEAARLKAAYERNEFLNLHEVAAKARQNLNQNAWDYIVGGVETETTLRRNRMALDTVAFRPRVLRDVSKVDASTELLGRKLRLPIVLCADGTVEIFQPEGAATVVKAAGEFGIAHMLSSVCDPGLEGWARAAPDACRMFQL